MEKATEIALVPDKTPKPEIGDPSTGLAPLSTGFPGASEKFCTLACPTPGSEGTPGSAMLCSLRRYVVSAARRPRTT